MRSIIQTFRGGVRGSIRRARGGDCNRDSSRERLGAVQEAWREASHRILLSQRHGVHGEILLRDVRAVCVHAGPSSAPRADSLERLVRGELEVIFSVDIFNEGVDLPNLDTVLMLRPTESTVIWMQQFGRGLRRNDDKPFLTVVDYIGNHRAFLTKLGAVAALTGRDANSDGALRQVLEEARSGHLPLPPSCSVTYDLECVAILEGLLRPAGPEVALEAFYDDFLDRHGVRPTAVEAYHEGYNPRSASERSWLGFVGRKGGFETREAAAWPGQSSLRAWKERLSLGAKIAVLLGMMGVEALPGSNTNNELADHITMHASRSPKVREDFSVDLDDTQRLHRLLIEHLVRALVNGEGTGGNRHFQFEEDRFSSTLDVDDPSAFRDLLREILDWRLAHYLDRANPKEAGADVICRLARNTGGNPIIFLPRPATELGLVLGPSKVGIDGEQFEALIAKIAINVVRRNDEDAANRLPEILRRWFGDDVGLPGRGDRVRLKRGEDGFELEPLRVGISKEL